MAFQPEAAQVAIFAALNHPGDSFADFVEGVAPLGSTARATLEGWLPSLLLSLFQALTLYSGLLEGLSRWEGAASQTEVAVATLRKVIDGRPTSNLASHADFSPRAVHNVTTTHPIRPPCSDGTAQASSRHTTGVAVQLPARAARFVRRVVALRHHRAHPPLRRVPAARPPRHRRPQHVDLLPLARAASSK